MKPSTSLMIGIAPSLIRRASSSAVPVFALAWRMAAYMGLLLPAGSIGLRFVRMQDRTPARARAPSGTGRGSDDTLAREWIRRAAADRGLWQPGEAGRTRRGFRRRRGRGFRLLQKQRGLEHYAGG